MRPHTLVMLLMLSAVSAACQGEAGPTGPAGPAGGTGQAGTQGPSGTVATAWGSFGGVPAQRTVGSAFVGLDCITTPYTAGAGERAIVTSNLTVFFGEEGSRQVAVGYTANGNALSLPASPYNGMATTSATANVSVSAVLPLQAGSTYRFQPALRSDIPVTTLNAVQCTTLAQIVRVP